MQQIDDAGFIKCIIDITNLSALFEKMTEVLIYGFLMKPTKGTYFLGRCGSVLEAQRCKSILIDTCGLDPRLIFIHPDDDPPTPTHTAV